MHKPGTALVSAAFNPTRAGVSPLPAPSRLQPALEARSLIVMGDNGLAPAEHFFGPRPFVARLPRIYPAYGETYLITKKLGWVGQENRAKMFLVRMGDLVEEAPITTSRWINLPREKLSP